MKEGKLPIKNISTDMLTQQRKPPSTSSFEANLRLNNFQSKKTTTPNSIPNFSPSLAQNPMTSGSTSGRTSDLLQNLIHFQNNNNSGPNRNPDMNLTSSSRTEKSTKRRGRKPAKNEICHVVLPQRQVQNSPRVESPDVTIQRVDKFEQRRLPVPVLSRPPPLPVLSEVTITPANPTENELADKALDLSKDRSRRKRSLSPEVVEIAVKSGRADPVPARPLMAVLRPVDYEMAGNPHGYVFCPTTNLFVHHSALNQTIPNLISNSNNQRGHHKPNSNFR